MKLGESERKCNADVWLTWCVQELGYCVKDFTLHGDISVPCYSSHKEHAVSSANI